ncbi:MAG: single-stranded DNA-binding protein [Bacteroidales bacterium]|nr:single-stranded DNA-binding protein [Bacteroidales bacterium]
MASVNKVILVGNVGRDPEVRHLEGGAAVANFSLATTERFRDRNGETREMTEWHTIVAWRNLADLAEKFIRKGSQIYVEGRIRSRSYDDQNGQKRTAFEILADTIQLLDRRPANGAPQGGAYAEPYQAPQQNYAPRPQPQPAPAPAPAAPAPQPAQASANPFESDFGDDSDLPF